MLPWNEISRIRETSRVLQKAYGSSLYPSRFTSAMRTSQAIACAYWSWPSLALQGPLWQVDLEDLVGCPVPNSILPGIAESVVGQRWLPLNPPLVLSPSGSDRRSTDPPIFPGLKSRQTWYADGRGTSSSLALPYSMPNWRF